MKTETPKQRSCAIEFDRRSKKAWRNPKLDKIWSQYAYEHRLEEIVDECREEILYANMGCFRHKRDRKRIRAQLSRSQVQGGVNDILRQVGIALRKSGMSEEQYNEHLQRILHTIDNVWETIILSTCDFRRCRTIHDILMCAWRTYKMLTHGNLSDLAGHFEILKNFVFKVFEDCDPPDVEFDFKSMGEVQGLEDFLISAKETMENVKEGYTLYKKIRHGRLMKDSSRVMRFCLTFGLFQQFGLTFDNLGYSEAEQMYIRAKHSSKLDFLEAVIDGAIFIIERSIQAIHLKSWSPFLHSSKEYGLWVDSAFLVREHYTMFSSNTNPEITFQSLLAEIDVALEQGVAIEKFAVQERAEKIAIQRLLSELRIIKCQLTSAKENQKMRNVPFSFLVFGDSSVAKTTLAHTLLAHYGRVRNLPNGPEFWYHRNPNDEYYSRFNPQMWGMVFDDAGAMHPNKMNGIDPAIGEIISISNPNPMMAPMAELELKGRCPIKTECLVVTSNVKDLHASTYYSFPLALRRRMPYVLTVSPRCDPDSGIDYRSDESPTMLDHEKVPLHEASSYPNLWNIKVEKIIAQAHQGTTIAKEVFVREYTDIYEFLLWFTEAIKEHDKMNAKIKLTSDTLNDDVDWKSYSCEHCLPAAHCPICTPIRVPVVQGPEPTTDDEWEQYYEFMSYEFPPPSDEDMTSTQSNLDCGWSDSEASSTKSEVTSYYSITGVPDIGEDDDGFLVGAEYNKKFACEEIDQFTNQSFASRAASFYEDASGLFLHTGMAVLSAIKRGAMKLVDVTSVALKSWLLTKLKDTMKTAFTEIGKATWKAIQSTSPLYMVVLALPVVMGIIGVGLWMKGETADADVQGGVLSSKVGQKFEPKVKDEKPNPWYDSQYEVSSFDVPTLSSSWKGKTGDEIRKLLQPNIVCLYMETYNEDVKVGAYEGIHALALGGHLFVTDSHLFPDVDSYRLRIIHGTDNNGVSINKWCNLSRSTVFRVPEKELIFFELNLPPRQDIRNLIPGSDYRGKVEGFLFQRDMNGYVSHRKMSAISRKRLEYTSLGRTLDVWSGKVQEATKKGDCGAVLVCETPTGPMITGLHLAAYDMVAESVLLTREDVEVATAHFGTPIISCNSVRIDEKNPLVPLHEKSVFRYLSEGTARVHGSFLRRSSPRTNVKPSFLAPILEEKGWAQKHGAPPMKGYMPWRLAVKPCVEHKSLIKPDVLRKAADGYLNDLIKGIPTKSLEELIVLNDEQALNGVPGVRYLEKMNRNSSAGYPFNKSKKFFLLDVEDHDGYTDCKDFTPEVWAEVDKHLEAYKDKRVSHPIFVGQLKDEALPFRKIILGKTRVFLIAPAAWTLIVRKYLLTFVRMFQKHRFITEGMPGLPAQCSAWGDVYHFLTKHGTKRMIAGDFKEYDKVLESTMSLECWRVIREFLKHAGWSDEDLAVVQAIAEDVAFPLCVVNGDLVEFDGTNPSGQPLTVILNCIANSIYMRYCYYELNPEHECLTFQQFVALITYGDDNGMGVSSKIPWFNHTSIQKVLATIGVEYTMADKTSESVPYIDIDKVDFLKRKWVYDESLPGWLAPLCEDSIEKMLMIGVESKTMSPEHHAIACVGTAVFEYFFYGEQVFEEKKAFLKEVVHEAGLDGHVCDSTFPSYETLKERWLDASAYEEHLKEVEAECA